MIVKSLLWTATFFIIPSLVFSSEIILKSGQKLEGKIADQTDQYVKIDMGVAVATTYYMDEIDSIDGVPVLVKETAVKPQEPMPVETTTEIQTEIYPETTDLAPVNSAQVYTQKDGLFKINIPDGWRVGDTPDGILILPPPPRGNGIVIKFKADDGQSIEEGMKRVAQKVSGASGSIIENKDITIDNVPAQSLLYKVSVAPREEMYFVRIAFVTKGYQFSINYGDFSQEEVQIALKLAETFKF